MTAPTPETQPVINSPFTEPKRHWKLDGDGRALPQLMEGRRASASRTMVPRTKKAQTQAALFPEDGYHEFINEVREAVREWRDHNYPGLSRIGKDLLNHWKKDPISRDNGPVPRLFFAQIEALETLMWLYEAPSKTTAELKKKLDTENANHNEGCNRLAVRMATGTGKTMVMAMLIAWHTVMHLRGGSREREKHARTFVIITPGLTVKERLQELDPKRAGNIYLKANLLPTKYKQDIHQASIRIVNYQAFRQRDLLEGASADQKKMIARHKFRRGQPSNNQLESYGSMLERVLNLPSGPQHRNIVVLNDEAHHCYGDVPEAVSNPGSQNETERERFSRLDDVDQTDDIKRAKQWFAIIEGLHKQKRLLVAHDLSATPYYVSHQWIRFPWILSDYDLHEALEAGLVKIPRVPVDDDAQADDVMMRDLFKHTRPKVLKREAIPSLVNQAMESLYQSYEHRFDEWKKVGHERLPVLIVVANNINNATALYDWISGYTTDEGWVTGAFPLLSNVDHERRRIKNPVAMIVHSEKLEDEEKAELKGTGADRMALVANEVATIRQEDDQVGSKKKEAEYLRQILGSVGKEGQRGENIRCVVSVGMLTEGWDARTVTHILGFRAFNSQLLCEQVAGRALRRVNYEATEKFEGEDVLVAEYSEILGIPFRFSNAKGKPPQPPEKTIEVMTQKGHEDYRIHWPQVEMYRHKIHSGMIRLNPSKVKSFDATTTYDEPTIVELAGIVGEIDLLDSPKQREQRIHYEFARYALRRLDDPEEEDEGKVPPNLRRFAQLLQATREWVSQSQVKVSAPWWQLLSPSVLDRALKSFLNACDISDDSLRIAVDLADPPVLDTSDIRFETSISGEMPGRNTGPIAYPARVDSNARRPFNKYSELNVAVCDSHLEWRIARTLDSDELQGDIKGWARNLRLGWTIPWLDDTRGEWHDYIPDFVVRMADCPNTGEKRHIVLEGKGYDDEHWNEKRDTVIDYWLPGVNASKDDACAGKWILLEVRPDNWMVERTKEPGLVCTVDSLAVSLKQLMSEERHDVWK